MDSEITYRRWHDRCISLRPIDRLVSSDGTFWIGWAKERDNTDVVLAQRATHSLFGRPWTTITFMTAQIAECRMIGVRMSGGRVRFRCRLTVAVGRIGVRIQKDEIGCPRFWSRR